ncbi:aminotransferase class I/II-fold pyridoxal phosphate-dependent enzyme [Vibrio sp. V27_P1S3P104]|uniref:amino acid aminotransferase n=1 Tax=unclassified Vibrio TaxID=2614977 RepID=UPI0013727BC1|nr:MULTISPECIES: amino acid aminotransferase [unclassified Vibrio]NAW70359.1 aminotransferase class I/II-fold pyridoxal phosphate-dependent enzyme [Vibrio sp. V28_P6S34P95]NAX04743.1 aminotransferase class I/II-fold pyridoxal phosphate-dependent enzyme [Vibrio sp. V30_P3S12P165]NAX35467.1 aminotransferase class I/II-fold pyridoxal phosphate-dependent enzyme [Vibrio sp. V29_P1S30P107]NAX37801.1 aminotransferase class I/II-fold pyridoxal phosphate-dependent enzyme [Vibrio sp. V27_P1S3P104]NAX408
MLSHLPTPTLDPILSLSVAFRQDPRPQKVDLGIGVYKNSQGETPIMQAVQQAQAMVVNTQTTKSYVGLAGCEEFNQHIAKLVLGETPVFDRLTSIQTPGASGALRMLGDLMRVAQPETTVWLTNPSYINHKPVMEAAGLKVKYYAYFNPQTKLVDVARMLDDLSHAGPKDVVLLHGCCHNPTGADIDLSAWQAITELALKQGFTPFVDIAYQGFGGGLEEDASGLRYMAAKVEEMLITTSCSKNFGLYRERTGAAIVLGKNGQEIANARGKMLTLARSTYTMPPDHGAALVKTILQSEALTSLWKQELNTMQHRLLNLRQTLCNELRNQHNTSQFDFIESHQGMFTVLGFSAAQMHRLREEFAIYGVADGRINIAGLTEQDIPYVAEAIVKVS